MGCRSLSINKENGVVLRGGGVVVWCVEGELPQNLYKTKKGEYFCASFCVVYGNVFTNKENIYSARRTFGIGKE